MSEIDAQRTTFALEQINQDLKLCLPLLGFQQQKHLLGLSNKMYHDFLSVERTPHLFLTCFCQFFGTSRLSPRHDSKEIGRAHV